MSDALNDILENTLDFDTYRTYVKPLTAALQDLIYTEVLDLIGQDKPRNGYCENDYGCYNAAQRDLRAKAAAKWGKK